MGVTNTSPTRRHVCETCIFLKNQISLLYDVGVVSYIMAYQTHRMDRLVSARAQNEGRGMAAPPIQEVCMEQVPDYCP